MKWLLLFLLFWVIRLQALDSLPLHNDEGLHVTRAVEVWNLHPFWEIRDGKIINHWVIALFYPQSSPVFVGRISTLFISLLGLAAGLALLRRAFGSTAALLGGLLWVASPYLFFYERMIFSDAEAGALAILAVWLAVRLADRSTIQRAILTGVALGLAALFKFTALPFAAAIAIIVLASRAPLGQRIRALMVIGVTVAALFSVPIVYLLLRGDDLFSIALGWVSGGGMSTGLAENLTRLWAQLTGFGTLIWTVALGIGLALLLMLRPRRGGFLLAVIAVPLVSILLLGRDVQPRHFVVALPGFLLLGGAGIGLALERWVKSPMARQIATIGIAALLVLGLLPFAQIAYTTPGDLPLPPLMRTQYVAEHSAGFGLREAVQAFPVTLTDDLPIIASMFPDSCRRANFYATDDRVMECTDAPGIDRIQAALAERGAVYVLTETSSIIGVDVTTLDADATRIAGYPRPGETEADAAVVLWRLDAR